MLPSRGLLRAGPAAGFARRALPSATKMGPRALQAGRPGATRQFGTGLQRVRPVLRIAGSPIFSKSASMGGLLAGGGLLPSRQLPSPSQQARYASTEPTPAATEDAFFSAVETTPIDISGSELLNMTERIGYLKDMGLDFGMGPTAMMQWLLEHIYIYTGLPWWASLAAVALLTRAVLFKPSLLASESSRKLSELGRNPEFAEARKRMNDLTLSRGQYMNLDRMTRMSMISQAKQDLSSMQRAANVNAKLAFVPMLNIPIALGMFRLVRGMSALPVPSLETGGTLWFTDLTVADPTFILPIAASVMLALSLRLGLPHMTAEQAMIMRPAMYIIAPVSIYFTIGFPAGLQLYFLLTGALQYLQTWLFYQPWVRQWAGLPPLEEATPTGPRTSPFSEGQATWQAPRTVGTTATPATGVDDIVQTAKGAMGKVREKWNDMSEKGRKTDEMGDAIRYEERRAAEEKERLRARREQARKRDL